MNYLIMALTSLLVLLILFVLLMAMKYVIIRNGWHDNKIVQIFSLVFSRVFDALDICANYLFFAPIVLHWPNKWYEGRTISEHANAIIVQYLTNEEPDSSRLEDWRFDVAMFVCELLNKIDPNHCGNLK